LHDPWKVLENCQWRWRNLGPLPAHDAFSSVVWFILKDWQQDVLGDYFIMPGWPNSLPQIKYLYWPNVTGPLAANVTNLLRPLILAAQCWDHSTLPPTMVIRNQGDLVLNLEKEKNGVGDNINLTRRDDLKPKSVELAFVDNSGDDDEDVVFLRQMRPIFPAFHSAKAFHPPGATPGEYGSVLVLDPFVDFGQVEDGLAEFIYGMLAVPVWEGSFTVQTYVDMADGGLPLHLAPGMTVNLSGEGYRPEWATMNAVIQAVELDIMTGKATVHVGANGHAALTDIMERARDALGMRFYNYMNPETLVPVRGLATCTLGDAIGEYTGNSGVVAGEVFFTVGNFSLTVTTDSTVGTGSVFAEIILPRSLGTGFTIIQTLGTNAEATALHAIFTCVAPNRLRISKRTVSAAPFTVYQWDLIIQQR
ncbi:MAG: hypothetical protein JWO08_1537, partial [Verrucomicrobiaceae bacterium]|nr:hypothetical protein [Verrucomicrobiaceae bacterium]